MKKRIFGAAIVMALAFCAGCASRPAPAVSGGPDELDAAIREASDYLNGKAPKGSKIVFLNIKSDYPDLSEYILSGLSENAVNDGVFTVVDRQQIGTIREELHFQMSGDVSDESAQSIGQMLGAQSIVSGSVSMVGSLYRIQIKAIAVQTAALQGQWSRNIPNGEITAALTKRYAPADSAGTPAAPRGKKVFPDFSVSMGGRVFYNGMFDIGKYSYSYTYAGGGSSAQLFGALNTLENNIHDNHGVGVSLFWDFTYAELGGDVIFGSFTPNAEDYSGDFQLQSAQIGFTLLGKLPIGAGAVTFFPLAGIDYQHFISGEGGDVDLTGDYADLFDAFSLVAGAGLDFNLSAKVYLRIEALCNFKMEGGSDKALRNLAGDNDISFSLFTVGPRASLGLGFKF
jgi:hypothetical protein